MFEKILYKMVIISPYILLALSFISLILGVVKKSSKEPCKKVFYCISGKYYIRYNNILYSNDSNNIKYNGLIMKV